MKRLLAAIIGTGGIAGNHLNALQAEKDRVEVVAAVDIDPQNLNAFCERFDIPHRYSDTQTMLDEQKPDLVHIATPPGTHFDLSVQALKGGAHVICEKPFMASLDEIDRMQTVERET